MSETEHHVVVVGAGFGGLELTRALSGAPVRITMIDKRNHHLFQPLLYQVATTSLATSEVAWPIRHLLRRRKDVTTLLGNVTGIDRVGKRVLLEDGSSIPYDTLVLATGARHAYFGHDEWEPFAPGLKTLEDATTIRRRILLAFEQAERETDPARRQALLTLVIVGGGPTGVELAGTIVELANDTLRGEFRNIDTRQARVVLIEAGDRILANFAPQLSDYARKALERLGVTVELGRPVTKLDAEGVVFGDKRLPARTIIWAAGVAASPAAEWLGAPADRAGRVIVEPDLTVQGNPDIFVIGDTACAAAGWEAGAGRGAFRQAGGQACRRDDQGAACRRHGDPSLPVPACRRPGDDRQARRRHRFRLDQAHRLARLVALGHSAHLFPDRLPQPPRGLA